MLDSARLDLARLRAAYEQVKAELLAERTPDGHWVGELSSSALATATAVSALAVVKIQGSGFRVQEASGGRQPPEAQPAASDSQFLDNLISRGVRYLTKQQNADGGFGDTDLSHSNIATTYLVVAALHLAGVADEHRDLLARADAYIETKGRLKGLRERYGIDKTFVVPIMTNLALAGLLDWREIDPLPFELACVPQAWYRFVGMPVVSYAIPALVAIGQARYFHAPPRNPLKRLIRWLSITRSLRVLLRMQPDSGGYLEATPLTSFVVMSLASLPKPRPVVGVNDQSAPKPPVDRPVSAGGVAPRPMVGALNPVADDVIREGVKFLAASIRPDGSWPIDTNLATWNTTLAINALAGAGEDVAELLGVGDEIVQHSASVFMSESSPQEKLRNCDSVLPWLISCMHVKRHPFTGASAGGFGWSDLSGAVPDADDTAGAIMAFGALVKFDMRDQDTRNLTGNLLFFFAFGWLIGLKNRDGGWPTFCRGWGTLPFDRSGTDLTAHALRAFAVTSQRFAAAGDHRSAELTARLLSLQANRALAFFRRQQHADGSWSPLWFGNQDHPTEDNPVYGTAKVLFAYRDLGLMDSLESRRGVAWLVANQNADGGWGSGVWRMRNAECGVRSGQSEMPVTGSTRTDHSALGTPYSVSSTESAASIPHSALRLPHLTSSVEETALAVEALLAAVTPEPLTLNPEPSLARGLAWLIDRVEQNQHRQPAPIGFYFAKLWYYERLYPLTFTVAALGRACRQFACPAPLDSNAQPAPARVP